MIDRLEITNFKAFRTADLRLGRYTLLSGLNSSGKSTVLQALALLRQAQDQGLLQDGDSQGGLPLNGELVELGTGQDVLNGDYLSTPGQDPEIGFRLSAGSASPAAYRARYGREDDLLPLIAHSDPSARGSAESAFTLFNPGFQYLRADRINPAVTFPRSHEMSIRRGFLGSRGEYTIDYLRHFRDEISPFEVVHHPGAASPRLLDQAEAWMSEICPGVKIQAEAIERTSLVRLGFHFTTSGQPVTGSYRPTNVGFGLTYVLPLVIACLTARPGVMLLLENPEAHVHPQGQTAIARLTCVAAAVGAQVIVETHSDHILNGVRLAVKGGVLSPEDVVLHYFRRVGTGIEVTTPAMGADGMLSQWPPGFFDEWDRSLDQLLE